MINDDAHMAHALQLAGRGLGRCWPNPAVGCVIVRENRIVGRGWTQPGGRPHAETQALAQAGEYARGATAYVTLEPCAHHGKTPPCADALIRAGVSRVVSALTDPDVRVSGRGHAMLQAAGVTVTKGVMEREARDLNAGFLKSVKRSLPFVTLKLATTIDGRIATGSGESRWITGEGARRAVHAQRMRHDAVMIGSGTAIADNPDLTVRNIGASHQPVRIIVDSALRTSPDSRLGRSAAQNPVWLLHADDVADAARSAWAATEATLIPCAAINGHLDLAAAMQSLCKAGLTRIYCEGGAGLAAALIRARLVDELLAFTAGALIGAEGKPAMGPLGLSHLADAPRLRLRDASRVGGDILARWAFD